jgi:hypothetical protein
MRRTARLPLEDPGAPDRLHLIGCPFSARAARQGHVPIAARAADIVIALIVGGFGGVLLYVIVELA